MTRLFSHFSFGRFSFTFSSFLVYWYQFGNCERDNDNDEKKATHTFHVSMYARNTIFWNDKELEVSKAHIHKKKNKYRTNWVAEGKRKTKTWRKKKWTSDNNKNTNNRTHQCGWNAIKLPVWMTLYGIAEMNANAMAFRNATIK